MHLQKALLQIHSPKGLTSVMAGVAAGDYSFLASQDSIGITLAAAQAKLEHYRKASEQATSDAAYWGFIGDVSYWSAAVNILKAAELVGPANLADIAPPRSSGIVMDVCASIEQFGSAILKAAEMSAHSQKMTPDLLELPVLSIRQPWAWLILHGKGIENRDWHTRFRGKFLIHAAKGCTRDEYDNAADFAKRLGITVPPLGELERGGIVGVAEITDCVDKSESPWFFGKWGFQLANARPVDFYPCKGRLGFFRL